MVGQVFSADLGSPADTTRMSLALTPSAGAEEVQEEEEEAPPPLPSPRLLQMEPLPVTLVPSSEGRNAASLRPRAATELPPVGAPSETTAVAGGGGAAAAAAATRARPRRMTDLMRAKWDTQIAEVEAAARNDPFSKTFDGGIKLRKGDAGYGVAAAGSQTAARAQKAQEWVDSEIEKLLGVIRQHGDAGSDGLTGIAFGELFDVYAHISDTLVGILMRARKCGRLAFESDMLFQGVHDDVRIRILV